MINVTEMDGANLLYLMVAKAKTSKEYSRLFNRIYMQLTDKGYDVDEILTKNAKMKDKERKRYEEFKTKLPVLYRQPAEVTTLQKAEHDISFYLINI